MRRPWRSMRKLGRQLLAGPYLVWIIGFILLPIVIILYYAFTNTSGAFTWDNIAAIADPVHVKSILLSLKLGFFCTVVCLLLAYPLAMILNSFHFKHQSFVVFLFVLPMWMNFMLRILAWRLLLSNNGIVNALFGLFGFGPVKMLNTPTAVVFGMVYDAHQTGRYRSCKRPGCKFKDRTDPHYLSADTLRRDQRNRHGFRSGSYLFRDLRSARRW